MQIIHEAILGAGAELIGYLHDVTEEIPNRAVRPALIVCPGGGYEFRSARETDPPALYFFQKGYQVFILHYSVGETAANMQPLKEASAALSLVRSRAAKWHIMPNAIAIMGFSAGGHLAASLGVMWQLPQLGAADGCNRPDAMVLCYPVITAGKFAHQGSIQRVSGSAEWGPQQEFWALDKRVSEKTPPAFLWHTYEDDAVPVENSLLMVSALRRAGVPCEFHLFETGPHGLSMCTAESEKNHPECACWPRLCLTWLNRHFQFKEYCE